VRPYVMHNSDVHLRALERQLATEGPSPELGCASVSRGHAATENLKFSSSSRRFSRVFL